MSPGGPDDRHHDHLPDPQVALHTREAAQALGISRSSLYVLLSQGAIDSVRIGGSRRITAAALSAFIDTLTNQISGIDRYHH